MKHFLDNVWKKDGEHLNKKMVTIIAGPLLIVLITVYFFLSGDRYVDTDNAYVKADKTTISAEVSGKITEVFIKNNQRVRKGDLLFAIDPETYQIALQKAQANLVNVRADVEGMKADYLQKLADYMKAEETVKFNLKEALRYRELANSNAGPKQRSEQADYDLAASKNARDSAKQEVESLKAKLGGNPNAPIEEHSSYKLALSDLNKAKLDLDRINVQAPSDGVVASVNIEVGEYINSGSSVFTLVDDKHLWVEANFKETDLTHVKVGQPAEIKVDTFPSITWKAKVTSITPATGSEFSLLPSQNSSGNWVKVVQRIMVKLEFEDIQDTPQLAAGMSAYVEVDTQYSRISRFFGFGNK